MTTIRSSSTSSAARWLRRSRVVNEDPAEAVQVYLRQAGNATDPELLASILADPQVDYTVEPSGIDKYLDFMRRIGTVKDNGQPWEAMFFE